MPQHTLLSQALLLNRYVDNSRFHRMEPQNPVWGPYGPLEALGIPMALSGTLILEALRALETGFKGRPGLVTTPYVPKDLRRARPWLAQASQVSSLVVDTHCQSWGWRVSLVQACGISAEGADTRGGGGAKIKGTYKSSPMPLFFAGSDFWPDFSLAIK
jgi:hypothetical protein